MMTSLPRPIQAIFDLFSSVRFGIVLLILLFLYTSIGSAGILYPTHPNIFDLDNWDQIVVRHLPGLEMTEYEWFHWWPFTLLIGLICTTLITTTLRRIRFSVINLGVWMIHSGIVILAAGSVWYFSTKFEGDALIPRRQIVITVPGQVPVRMLATPGNQVSVGEGDSRYQFAVASIDPQWQIRTGEAEGTTTYAVSVRVRSPQRMFIRQLLDRFPQFTEDVIPGEGRAVKVTGERLLDSELSMTLEPVTVDHFYLAQSEAIYLREVGSAEWIERPIEARDLPRYNDYVQSPEEVWVIDPRSAPRAEAVDLIVPAIDENDPLPKTGIRVASYLRYAFPQARRMGGGTALNPFVSFRVKAGEDDPARIDLLAFEPDRSRNDLAAFRWIDDEAAFEALRQIAPAVLEVEVPGEEVRQTFRIDEIDFSNPDQEFRPVEGTDYSIRIQAVEDDLSVRPGAPARSVAIVDVRTPQRTFNRWVFDDPSLNRDQIVNDETGETEVIERDEAILMTYRPAVHPAFITIVAGPEVDRLRVVALNPVTDEIGAFDAAVGREMEVITGIKVTIDRYLPRSREVVRPTIVPPSQRNRDLDMKLRMIRVEVPGAVATGSEAGLDLDHEGAIWLEFHDYPFAGELDAVSPFIYKPTRVSLRDGREIELLFSRRRMKLPAPVALSDFIVNYHVGGFANSNLSVRNWTSVLKFGAGNDSAEDDRTNDTAMVAVNDPAEYRGFWFFQSGWDPPDPVSGSSGMSFTILGIGNREGVYVQLLGCAIAVLGMFYAFYIKPILKRRREKAIRASIEADASDRASNRRDELDVVSGDGQLSNAQRSSTKHLVRILFPFIAVMGSLAPPARAQNAPREAEPAGTSFAARVDLSELGQVAVQDTGRFKSLDSFASSVVQGITGPRTIDDQSSTFTYFDMMFRPGSYLDRDVIYVRKKLIRQRIANALREDATRPPGPETHERLDRFLETGLISPHLLQHPAAQAELSRMRADLMRTAKYVQEIDTALALMDYRVLLGGLRVAPQPGTDSSARWLTIDEFAFADFSGLPDADQQAQQAVREAWEALFHGWREEDAEHVNDAAAQLAQLLPAINDEAYPDQRRTGWPWSITAETFGGWTASAGVIALFLALLAVGLSSESKRLVPVSAAAVLILCGLHAGSLSLGRLNPLALESFYFNNFHWFTLIWVVYMFSVIFLLMSIVYRWSAARVVGLAIFLIAFALHSSTILLRWYVADRWPNSNMFEAVTTAAWFGGCAAIMIEMLARRTAMHNLFALGSAAASMVALMAAHFLPQYLDAHISNRMPVLHDIWLYIHTNVIIFSYCLIFMAAMVALVYLAYRAALALKGLDGSGEYARVGGAGSLILNRAKIDRSGTSILDENPGAAGAIEPALRRTSLGQVFDGATMILMELSFILLWTGIIMGAMWADHSWGRPWGWDPKEVFALNTFIVFAVLIHVRYKSRDKGLWTSLLVLAGCVVMLFNWIFINFKISGLHSYA